MNELKLCPFCGGKAHAAYHNSRNKDDEYYLIMCAYCFARTVGETVEEAIDAWNRRINDEK
jgi:Lar family restriction alleviation protein